MTSINEQPNQKGTETEARRLGTFNGVFPINEQPNQKGTETKFIALIEKLGPPSMNSPTKRALKHCGSWTEANDTVPSMNSPTKRALKPSSCLDHPKVVRAINEQPNQKGTETRGNPLLVTRNNPINEQPNQKGTETRGIEEVTIDDLIHQ